MNTDEQKRICPLCGESKTLRGLHGHLKIKHYLNKEEVNAMAKQAAHPQIEESENTANLESLWDVVRALEDRVVDLENDRETNADSSGNDSTVKRLESVPAKRRVVKHFGTFCVEDDE